jgi:putative ABC transport system permease protein
MSGWRTALRIARRQMRRAKGRSTLVVAMIAVPVAAMSFVAVAYDTFTLTPDEEADRVMGTADAAIAWPFEVPAVQFPLTFDGFPARPDGSPPADEATEATSTAPTLERLLPLLPPGTRAIPTESGRLRVRTATGTGTVVARMLAYADPLARGIYRPLAGRAPATPDEVALTPEAVRRLGGGIGTDVRLADGSRAFRVVGLVEDPGDLSASTIVLPPGALPTGTLSSDRADLKWLVDTPAPVTWNAVRQLNTHGILAVSRHVLAHPPDPEDVGIREESSGSELAILVLIGGLAVLEIILLAGPAFAVGARRRQRELALVAAVGGAPAHVRRIVLADGVVLGAIAAVCGVVLGVGVLAALRPLFEQLGDGRSGALRVYPEALAVLAGLAVVTGVLAALVPAWIASRQDVVRALAGRRGITRSRRRWAVLGAGLGAAGAGLTVVGAWRIDARIILAGLAVAELGLVLATPALVGLLARVGRWLPLAPRIALRDTSRNRTAAAPAISAVMAAVVGSIAAGVVLGAVLARESQQYRSAMSQPGDVFLIAPGKGTNGTIPADAIETLRSTLPVTQTYAIRMPSCDGGFCDVEVQPPPARACPYAPGFERRSELSAAEQRAARSDPRCEGVGQEHTYAGGLRTDRGMTMIIEPDAAGRVAGLSAEDASVAAAALRAGQVVVGDGRDLVDGRVTLKITALRPDGPVAHTVTAAASALPHRSEAPIALMTEATARSLGLEARPFGVLATTSRIPTVAEQDRAESALGTGYYVNVEREPPSDAAFLVVLAVVAAVITLGAAAIATGLAAADSRADLATLAAVGASPRVRRALSLSQAGVIAGLGSVLGVVAGLGASVAVLFALNQRYAEVWPAPLLYPIRVPWLNIGIALIVVPLIAMLGAGLLTRSRLPIERRE